MSRHLCFVSCLGLLLAVAKATESSSAIFTVKEKYRNTEGVFFKSKDYQTMLSCGHACFQNSRCLATNFRYRNDGRSVCEFVDAALPTDVSSGLEFDDEWVFSLNMKDDCRFVACSNGGSCIYDSNTNYYRCSCPLLWTGDKCQHIEVSRAVFEFSTLGFYGRRGPTDNKRYKDTVLEGTLIVNGIQTWMTPVAGKYHVTACGAAGGNGTNGSRGGKGSLVNGTLQLQKGEVLKIMIGQLGETKGESSVGSGGGATFLAENSNPVAIAGGGGGGGISIDGGNGGDECGISVGNGGDVCADNIVTSSGGGGGFRGNGMCFQSSTCVNKACENGGQSFLNGGEGGLVKSPYVICDGGFGGGGSCSNAPGGGGGYSGGKVTMAMFSNGSLYTFAEGGCSLAPPDGVITPGYNEGDGYATIKLVP